MRGGAPKGAIPTNDNATGQGGVEGLQKETKLKRKFSSPNHKWERVLDYFLTGRSLNRFEAEMCVNDHCLHSTISGLERDSGVTFDRTFEVVPCLRRTSEVRVKRYWLRHEADNLARARAARGLPSVAANDANGGQP